MRNSSHLYPLIAEISPRGLELLQRLGTRPEPFALRDATFPKGGASAWTREFEELWKAGLLEREGWGQTPRFRLKADVRATLDEFASILYA